MAFAVRQDLVETAELSHRLEVRAISLVARPGGDATTELADLADGDAVALALALSYAFRHGDRHPEDRRYRVAARLLARALDGVRAAT